MTPLIPTIAILRLRFQLSSVPPAPGGVFGHETGWPLKYAAGFFLSLRELRIVFLVLLSSMAIAACSGHQPAPVRLKGSSTGSGPSGAFGTGPSVVSVMRGDTVYAISRRTGASVRAIIDHNRLRPPYKLALGQKIKLPAPLFHGVRKGDTAYSISRRYGIDMASLARANYIRRPYTLRINQRLVIPGRSADWSDKTTAKLSKKISKSKLKKQIPPPPKRSGKQFSWPVRGKILSVFGPKPGGLHNDGINIAVKKGADVRAAENGVVAYSGNELRGFGNLLLLRHAGGWVTAYAHNERLLVKRGDRIRRNQVIAKAGGSGNVRTPQLHFEIRKGAIAVNPRQHLSASLAPQSRQAANSQLAQVTSGPPQARHINPG